MSKELEMLAAEAVAVEAEDFAAMPQMPGNEPVSVIDQAKAWAELPAIFGSLLAMALPDVKPYYAPELCREWGEKMVPVADELGWNASEVLGPKLALAVATIPFIAGPVVVVKKMKEAEKAKRIVSEGAALPPEAPTESGDGIKIVLGGS